MASRKSTEDNNAVLDAKLANIQKDLMEMKNIIRGDYVRRDEFMPVKNVVFGLVAAVLMAVLGGVISLVIKK